MKKLANLHHLISVRQLDRESINTILTTAAKLQKKIAQKKIATTLKGRIIANLFFEPSTRTRYSFEIAARRLSALTITPHLQSSSLLKGETLLDTIDSLSAMGVDAFVIRHTESGILPWLTENVKKNVHIISAGEGQLQHPTQALLDLLTIQQHKTIDAALRVAIIGDLRHSRVAASLIDALTILGVHDIRLICPKNLAPKENIPTTAHLFDTLNDGIKDADVIVCLRLQKERMPEELRINDVEFNRAFGITQKNLKIAQPDAIVMHPGPINHQVEISSDVAYGSQSVILQQVNNGVAIRMAILKLLLA